MRIFLAMLLDAYRQLNSKKLFWITLIISGMVVIAYGSMGFDENGMTLFYGLKKFPNEFIREGSPIATLLYRTLFSSFIVGIWLTWVATILALVSTTSIFPDFLAGGAVDLVLSKPIGRVRLFFIKYVCSLLFVILQVSLFCIGVFFLVRWRLGEWNWMIFAAIPIVTVFYSYLYSVNVLLGILTRSALTALLLTMLFWVSLFGANTAEGITNQIRWRLTLDVEKAEADIADLEHRIEQLPDDERSGPVGQRVTRQIENQQAELAPNRDRLATLETWVRRLRLAQLPLPKTSETVGLLDRWLRGDLEVTILDILSGNVSTDDEGNFVPKHRPVDREVTMRMQEEYDSRSLWYVIGTSVGFEALVLVVACFFFVRRDF